jgi:hypothetical protein
MSAQGGSLRGWAGCGRPRSTGLLLRGAEHGPGSEDQQQQRGRLDRDPDLWACADCLADQDVPAEGERARQGDDPIHLDRLPRGELVTRERRAVSMPRQQRLTWTVVLGSPWSSHVFPSWLFSVVAARCGS